MEGEVVLFWGTVRSAMFLYGKREGRRGENTILSGVTLISAEQ